MTASVFGIGGNDMCSLKKDGLFGSPNMGNHKKSTDLRKYQSFLYQCLDMRLISMFILGVKFQANEDLNNNYKKISTYLIWKLLDN